MKNNRSSAPMIEPENKPVSQTTDRVYSRTHPASPGKRALKVGLILISLILVAILALGGGLWILVSQNVRTFDASETLKEPYDTASDPLEHPLPEVKGITNILLLGVDNRDAASDSIAERSDSMMILTVDSVHGQIKLTSLQRDMSVYIPGKKGTDKINAANALGGPLLAMRVVSETLRLDIQKFVVVNMAGLEKIIDAAGGVTLDVSDKELKAVNEELAMVNKTFPDTEPSPALEQPGIQLLNGRQAVTYARIRKIDSDYARMERQREVLQALAEAALKAGPQAKIDLAHVGLSQITTNLTTREMFLLGLRSLPLLTKPIAQLQIPIEGYYKNVSGEVWKSLCDFNGMIPLLQDFIYGQTFPFDPVKEIEGAPGS
ncbi:MAG: LCP family protein [Eubacteriales bacterium]|nr:LCP family protein [Eubacteriales bacterium]